MPHRSQANKRRRYEGPLANGHRTIAILGASMASAYNAGVMLGAADYAKQHGYNVIVFAGGPLRNPDLVSQARDKIFDIIDPTMFSGMVLPLSSLSRYSNQAQIDRFLSPFRHLPIATIGSDFEDTISVSVDNQPGMFELVCHLIEEHGYRKIAFASGAVSHQSSNEKLAGYVAALAHHGIAYDPAYVVHGDLTRNSSNWCAEQLFDERKLEVDVIVSVNDNQAFAIIDSLRERGIRVPQDIAVTGCMDLLEASVITPALTTVREPMYELGWIAAKAVIDVIEGRGSPQSVLVPATLVLRQSCGCSAAQRHKLEKITHSDPQLSAERAQRKPYAELMEIIQSAAHKATQSLGATILREDLKTIAKRFSVIKKADELAHALGDLEGMVTSYLRSESITAWLAIIPALQRYIRTQLADKVSAEDEESINQAFESCFAMLSQKTINYRNMVSEKYVNAFRELSIFLNVSFNPEVVRRLIVRELNAHDCYVCVYDDKHNVAGSVRNLLSIKNGVQFEVEPKHQHYSSRQILPSCTPHYTDAYSLVVLPMSSRAEPIGYLVVDIFDRKGVVLEHLQSLLSGALKTEQQLSELQDAEQRFSDIALSASDWLWEVDEKFRYTFCSDGVANVLGYTAEEMIGRSLFDFVLPSEDTYLELVKDYLIPHHLPLSNMEHINVHKYGHEVTLVISGKPVLKEDRLVGYRGAFKDTTEVKAQEDRIRELAYNDALTGLPNRTLFHDRLHMLMAIAQREPQRFAIFFLDLDRFKNVNDTLGHDAGDMLLKEVARRLSTCIREVDTLARLGGDEFTILLTKVDDIEDVICVAKRIIQSFIAPFELRGHQLFVTTSIGIAIYPSDGDTSLSMLKNADKAMYKAKEQGKNCYVFYDAEMGEKTSHRMQIEAALHQALKNDHFKICYQPQVRASNGHIVGAEALIRLHTPELGHVSPADFIPLAEEIGLIEDIGLWVFKAACKQAWDWHRKGYDTRVAINVSARQLKNSALAKTFIDVVKKIGVSPHLIEIEITENAVIENEKTAKEILEAFSKFGFKIAIDDFGTGYSSLSSLKKFPIDTVKIDRSFINDALSNPDNAHIVAAVIQIAKALRLNVIAEGVETVEQLHLLRHLGCNEIQGYLFSRPMFADDLNDVLKRGTISVE